MADPKKLAKKLGRWLFKKASEAAQEEINRRIFGSQDAERTTYGSPSIYPGSGNRPGERYHGGQRDD